MEKIYTIGKSMIQKEELLELLPSFIELYRDRPFKDNKGGMGFTHMFYVYYLLKKLKPDWVVECGVWFGQGTWLIERSLEKSIIFSLDPNLKKDRYIAKNAIYDRRDFEIMDFGNSNKEKALVLFDDHQNALERIDTAKDLGFKHLIFEDNEPTLSLSNVGSFYTVQEALLGLGYDPSFSLGTKIRKILWTLKYQPTVRMISKTIKGLSFKRTKIESKEDGKRLLKIIESYDEFPPLTDLSSFGKFYQKPLLDTEQIKKLQEFVSHEEKRYNWMCYVGLNKKS